MSSIKTNILLTAASLLATSSALGINCRGSGLCGFATIENNSGMNILQLWHDVLNATTISADTTYANGDHVVCIGTSAKITVSASASAEFGSEEAGASGGLELGLSSDFNIGTGGVCLFPQGMASGATLTLAEIRALVDALGEHGCATCGSVPIHFVDEGSNSPDDGILTSNYVGSPFCDDNCISSVGSS